MTTNENKMVPTIYQRIINKTGSIPKCYSCNKIIELNEKYVSIGERRYNTKRYCLNCADEKNIVAQKRVK